MTRLLSLILTLSAGVILASCASNKSLDIDYDMACDEIAAEIDKTRQALYNEKTKQTSGNTSEVAGTAATVAVTGAGLAGVPYVGGIYSIGRTLFSHRKRTVANQAGLYQVQLDELEYLAQRKKCNGFSF